jgi:pimeloyl-ACP methyl ester carboxylesterase
MNELDLELGDGRTLHVYDAAGDDRGDTLAVFWHHGTPNLGAPPEPLLPAADRLGVRWVSYDRPGYGGSTPAPGRDLASAAGLVASVADTLGIDRFAVMGHSGGGSHALACAALLSERVLAVVDIAGLAPFGAEGLDWFAGMAQSGVESLRAAAAGRAAKESYEASGAEYDPEFTPADEAALSGPWSWLMGVLGPAMAQEAGRADRRRSCLCRGMGSRSRAAHRADPHPARRSRPGRAVLSQRVARAPMPLGRAAAEPRRRAHLDPQLERVSPGMASDTGRPAVSQPADVLGLDGPGRSSRRCLAG